MRFRVLILTALAVCGVAPGQEIRLDDTGTFRADLPAGVDMLGAADILAVFVDAVKGAPPVLGNHRAESGQIVFTPRYPLQPGLRYRAELRAPGKKAVTAFFDIPAADLTPTTFVEAIYPSTNRLPENQLKFYLQFSAPMSRGEAYRRIRLTGPNGELIDLPFLEIDQELWDAHGQRLTLLFDPGRIKRGLVPHQEAGLALEAGKSYALTIDPEWRDAEGKPLTEEFRKSFSVGKPDRTPPDPKSWILTPPAANSRSAVTVEFDEPLDRALLDRLLYVATPAGRVVPGDILIDRQETRWSFTPAEAWKPGSYLLEIGTVLEDLAGNSIARPFEVDVFEKVEERVTGMTTTLRFSATN